MIKFKNHSLVYIVFLLILILKNTSYLKAEECLGKYEFGTSYNVIVPANPELTIDGGYNPTGVKQRAIWQDSKLLTNGESFYFEITGAWTPWYANTKNTKDSFGNSMDLIPSGSVLCPLKVVNSGNTSTDIDGEFDYLESVFRNIKKNPTTNRYDTEKLSDDLQFPCWLTAGEGLYISFFGGSGYEQPEIATHLKSATIKCDSPNNTDKNGDGFFSPSECYSLTDKSKKNKAYYAPFLSENMVGGVYCPADYFHGTDMNKIGVGDCYKTIKDKDDISVKTDQTVFTYKINNFYKKADKSKSVGRGEVIKFVVYDSFYRDNEGQYIIKILNGIDSLEDMGLVEKILTEIETMFVGKRDSTGTLQGGIMKTFFESIVKDSTFIIVIRMMLILYITFLGLSFAMGSLEYTTKELMGILLKLVFVISFTTETSWYLYDYFFIRFFLDGFSSLIGIAANITLNIFDPTEYNPTNALSFASKFAFIDQVIVFLLSDTVANKLLGLFVGVWFGFLVIPIFLILVIYYVLILLNVSYPYIVMFIQAIFALVLGPVFIIFYLFNSTTHMFKSWLAFIGAKFMNIAFLFIFLFAFNAIIKEEFKKLLSFEVCKTPIFQALFGDTNNNILNSISSFFSFGINIWDAKWDSTYPEPTLFGFLFSLLYIYILIELFSMLAKEIPGVVDSMISIDGDGGGSTGVGGNTSLTDALNDGIKVSHTDSNGNQRNTGFFDYYSGKTATMAGKYTTDPLKKTIKDSFTNAKNNFVSSIKNSSNKIASSWSNEVFSKNTKNMEDVNSAVEQYGKTVRENNPNNLEYQNIDNIERYRKSLENKFMESQVNNIKNDLKKLGSAGNSPEFLKQYATDKLDETIYGNFSKDKFQTKGYKEKYGDEFVNKLVDKNFSNSEERTSSGEMAKSTNYGAMRSGFELQKIAEEEKLGNKINNLSEYNQAMHKKMLSTTNPQEKEKLDLRRKGFILKETERMQRNADRVLDKQQKAIEDCNNKLNSLYDSRNNKKQENLTKESERLKLLQSSETTTDKIESRKSPLPQTTMGQAGSSKSPLSGEAELKKLPLPQNTMDQEESSKSQLSGTITEETELKKLGEHIDNIDDRIKGKLDHSYEELRETSKLYGETTELADNKISLDIDIFPSNSIEKELEVSFKELESISTEMVQSAKELDAVINDKELETLVNSTGITLVEGINPDTFFMKGLTTLGLGEDNKDILGFGEGASAAILGSEFKKLDKSLDDKDDQIIEQARLRMAKQNVKILKYKLEIAKNNAKKNEDKNFNASEVGALEVEIEKSNREIKGLENKIDDD